MKATWNGVLIAESDATVVVEGNHYFPRPSVDEARIRPSTHTTECPWKGTAQYFDVVVGDDVNANAAWVYPAPKEAAVEIQDRLAFWKGVKVTS